MKLDENITVTFSLEEFNTIDVTLRMRAMNILLELDDVSISEAHRNKLNNEHNRIKSLLESYDVFCYFKNYYENILTSNDNNVTI